jgi:hypothetical protein
MLKETVVDEGGVRVVLMDSISYVDESDIGAVVVSASHGGLSSGEYATRFALRLVFFNDAGVGKDQAGRASLELLQKINRAAATVSHDSARIGDAADHWEHGVVSAANGIALAAGVRTGAPVRDVIAQLRQAGPQ